MKYLITSGCSFSHPWPQVEGCHVGWINLLENKLREKNPNLIALHTGHNGHGQEMIQKKVSLTIMELLSQGIDPKEIFVAVMWSGTFRKSWYIDSPQIIDRITSNMIYFDGGMDPMFLDLKNNVGDKPEYFYTKNGSKFPYNPNGGWYTTVNGSDCKLAFVQEHYSLDGWHGHGVGKVHISLENIILLQNLCKLHGIPMVNQFFMDHVYQDIEQNKDHQIINYLYKQFDFENSITEGMFETLHELLNIPRHEVRDITHEQRKKLNANTTNFAQDGFHPGNQGFKYWCDKVLFPFLKKKNID